MFGHFPVRFVFDPFDLPVVFGSPDHSPKEDDGASLCIVVRGG
jgi:hypothetical protein